MTSPPDARESLVLIPLKHGSALSPVVLETSSEQNSVRLPEVPEWQEISELVVLRTNRAAQFVSGSTLRESISQGEIALTEDGPILLENRIWLCGDNVPLGALTEVAERQLAAANRCLAGGAFPADSGIRLRVKEILPAAHLSFHRPFDLGCLHPMQPHSAEPDVVDVYLHGKPWSARACPDRRRIFIGAFCQSEFTLAHEVAHLLGMPTRAHVDDNCFLRRGNVMDQSAASNAGALTLGQIIIFHVSRESIVARIRNSRDPSHLLKTCLNEHAEPVDAPSLGFHFTRESIATAAQGLAPAHAPAAIRRRALRMRDAR